ncbi:MAG: carbohydrate ABC transporter permease [Chloroflexota bacterium]
MSELAIPATKIEQTSQKMSGVKGSTVLYYGFLVTLALIVVVPILVMFMTSFKYQVDILSSKFQWTFTPTLANYENIFTKHNFGRYLVNSIAVGLGSTFLTLLSAGMAAYALARLRFPGRGLMAQTTLIVRMVPPAVLAVPIFALWGQWGLEDGRLGLVLFYTALNLPFAIWVLIGFIKQIPVELEEAAIVDGANPFHVFFLIMLPLMRGGIAVAGIFAFRIAWNEFILALILTDRFTRTLPVQTTLFLTEQGVEWGLVAAMGSVLVIPPLIITFLAARQIIAGLTAGAVKG